MAIRVTVVPEPELPKKEKYPYVGVDKDGGGLYVLFLAPEEGIILFNARCPNDHLINLKNSENLKNPLCTPDELVEEAFEPLEGAIMIGNEFDES